MKIKFVIIFCSFASILFAQLNRSVTLNKSLGHIGGETNFYLGKVSYLNDLYSIEFYFTSKFSSINNTKLDNIFVGNHIPVDIKGIKLGYLYDGFGHNKSFTVTVNPQYEILCLRGVGTSNKNFDINIREFDQYFKTTKSIQVNQVQDKSKPSIKLNSPELIQNIYRTAEANVTIRGKATDPEGIFTVNISGKNANLKADGSFMARVKLKIGRNKIRINTTDINDNISNKEFFVIREEFIEDNEFSDVDFPFETGNINKNGIAIVFGIEEYQYSPSVSFAYNDADIFREYLITTFGFKRENIYYRTNNRATKGEFEKVFSNNGWLANNSNKKSDVFIFYAGHGAPDLKSNGTYLIPSDIDPNYATTGYSLEDLYKNLGSIKAKSITVVLDACFSGGTRENQSLLADARPVFIEIKSVNVSQNTIVFSAASGSEISSAYNQKKHGIFTYYFLKGLNGNADKNKDKKITVSEMQNYLNKNVSTQARKMGREQNPQLLGTDKNRVLLKY